MDNERILIVEDETIIALHIRKMLDGMGYAVAGSVTSGEEAVDLAGESRPDLVLMDIILAGDMDGIEAAAQIRKNLGIPVVFLTANADIPTVVRARTSEPFGYVLKPVNIQDLFSTIDTALNRHALEKKLDLQARELEQANEELQATNEELNTTVSSLMRAEESLRESNKLISSIFRAAPVGIGLVSERVILEANDRLCEMTGYSREDLIGQNARMLYPTQEDFDFVGSQKYRQIAERGTGTVDTKWLRKDGAIIDVLLSSTPLDAADLKKGVTFTALDMTERKRMEHALHESESRYRMVLELTTDYISVLNLQAGEIDDGERLKSLKDTINRVRSMSRLHEDLYQSENIAHVNFNDYCVHLGHDLMQSYGGLSRVEEIGVRGERMELPLGRALPCVLILNEIITNSLKHAFPPAYKAVPAIEIFLEERDDGMCSVSARDNGVGLPPSVDLGKGNTLGMTLLPMLARQLGAEITVDRGAGTAFSVVFRK